MVGYAMVRSLAISLLLFVSCLSPMASDQASIEKSFVKIESEQTGEQPTSQQGLFNFSIRRGNGSLPIISLITLAVIILIYRHMLLRRTIHSTVKGIERVGDKATKTSIKIIAANDGVNDILNYWVRKMKSRKSGS